MRANILEQRLRKGIREVNRELSGISKKKRKCFCLKRGFREVILVVNKKN